MENQRLGDFTAGKALDATQKDKVVSTRIACFVAALEPGYAAFDQRHIGESFAQLQAAASRRQGSKGSAEVVAKPS